MQFTLLIPTYNEAPVIGDTLAALTKVFEKELGSSWKIIVIDNASTDGTSSAARKNADQRIEVLELKEKGKGRAIRAGATYAQSEWLGYSDVDLSVPPEEIVLALRLAEKTQCDLVLGSRFHHLSTMHDREWWRTASSHIFHILAKLIVGIRATDTQCPLKIMNTSGKKKLLDTSDPTWFFDLELVKMAEKDGMHIEEIAVSWDEHRYPERKSKVHALKDGILSIRAMLHMRKTLTTHRT